MTKRTVKYTVLYYTLEPSYYEHSEKIYVSKDFYSRKEAMTFAEDAKKLCPAEITVTRTQTILNISSYDNYQENRVVRW